jgi:hypothetical protein
MSNLPSRRQSDYLHLGRRIFANHFRTEINKSNNAPRLNKITDFISRRVWSWLYYYVKSRFGRPHPYPGYTGTQDRGIYPLGHSPLPGREGVCLAICADWATDTPQSRKISGRMRTHLPDYTVHLGDTYFVGEPKEIAVNFLAPGAPWGRGNLGSFAVLGNHEMYAQGISFFNDLLPTLGLRGRGQQAGYFCLENDYWRILGLDTGYHSIGKPVLELLPWFAPDCALDEGLVRWLRDDVRIGEDQRGLVLFTHHQYITSFNEPEYMKPASQIAALIGEHREVLWLWGHEHRFSVFEKVSLKGGLTAYGRCIGHGGMPVEVDSNKRKSGKQGYSRLVAVDDRVCPDIGIHGDPLGYNGYVVMNVNGPELRVEYHDENRELFRERWISDGKGALKGSIEVPPDCPLRPVTGKDWPDAVR